MPPIHPLRPPRDAAASLPIAVVCAVDTVLRDALTTDLLLDDPDLVALRYDTVTEDPAEGQTGETTLRRLVLDAEGVRQDEPVDLDHECISCAMRLDALPVIERIQAFGRWRSLVLVLPVAADPQAVAGALGAELRGAHLSTVTALVDADRAREDLLGDDTLAERGLCWAAGDARSVGEALAAQIEYADIIVAAGERGSPGAELVEHLRGADQLLVPELHDVSGELLLGGQEHDVTAAARRVDPRSVQPGGGPTEHGTWTLDLVSERPFHPERFLAHLELLGGGALRGRGRFWLPTRPHSICQWDGAGGQVSVGVIGEVRTELPSTRLVVTGIGDQDRHRVMRAFAASLLDDAEWQRGLLPWLGRDDGMSPWLGEHSAAS